MTLLCKIKDTDLWSALGVCREGREEKNVLNSVWEKANTEKRLQGAQDQQIGHHGQGYVRGQTCHPGGSVICQSLAMGLDKGILSSPLQCKVVTSGDSYVHQYRNKLGKWLLNERALFIF